MVGAPEGRVHIVASRIQRSGGSPRFDRIAPHQAPDCRTPVRRDKVVDGIDALPDENAQARPYRNGAGLQYQTGNEHSGRWRIDGSDPSMRSASRGNWPRLPTSICVFTQPGSKTDFAGTGCGRIAGGSFGQRRARWLAHSVRLVIIAFPFMNDLSFPAPARPETISL